MARDIDLLKSDWVRESYRDDIHEFNVVVPACMLLGASKAWMHQACVLCIQKACPTCRVLCLYTSQTAGCILQVLTSGAIEVKGRLPASSLQLLQAAQLVPDILYR